MYGVVRSRPRARAHVSPDAGWSSPVARWAHNPKVGGSNPPPATNLFNGLRPVAATRYSFLLTVCRQVFL